MEMRSLRFHMGKIKARTLVGLHMRVAHLLIMKDKEIDR